MRYYITGKCGLIASTRHYGVYDTGWIRVYPSGNNIIIDLRGSGNNSGHRCAGLFAFNFNIGTDLELTSLLTYPGGSFAAVWFRGTNIEYYASTPPGPSTGYYYNLVDGTLYKPGTAIASGGGTGSGKRVRVLANGTTLKAKAWSGAEPGWQISVTDSTYDGSYYGGYYYFYKPGDVWQACVFSPFGVAVGEAEGSAPVSGSLRTISGQVTLAGSPVQGAQVTAVRLGVDTSRPLIPGVDVVTATTGAGGYYALAFDTNDPGPWIISATAIVNNVYYASDARLVYFS